MLVPKIRFTPQVHRAEGGVLVVLLLAVWASMADSIASSPTRSRPHGRHMLVYVQIGEPAVTFAIPCAKGNQQVI